MYYKRLAECLLYLCLVKGVKVFADNETRSLKFWLPEDVERFAALLQDAAYAESQGIHFPHEWKEKEL